MIPVYVNAIYVKVIHTDDNYANGIHIYMPMIPMSKVSLSMKPMLMVTQ